ncbi:bacteriophage antitermination protein Q, partial [Enterobacter hormaechei]
MERSRGFTLRGNPCKKIHVVELDNGRGGVRRVKAENSALYVLETRSRRRPMPPIRDKTFSSCAWRRAVLSLDSSQQAWIRYCYGFEFDFGYQTEICRYVWVNTQSDFSEKSY